MTLKGIAKGLGWVVLVALAILAFFLLRHSFGVGSRAGTILLVLSIVGILLIGAVFIEWISRPFSRDKEIMTSKRFVIDDVLDFGWKVMKANFWFFVGLGLVAMLVIILLNIFYALIESIIIYCIGFIISRVLGIGFTKIALSFCDGRKPSFGTLFEFHDCFWRYLGASLLYYTLLFVGLLLIYMFPFVAWGVLLGGPLVIITIIIWAIKFSLWPYFVIDKKLGPIQALKASSRSTMGVTWRLFCFYSLCALTNLLGLLCLVVGIFAAYPTVIVASALVYRHLTDQTPELAEFGISTSYSQAAEQNPIAQQPTNNQTV